MRFSGIPTSPNPRGGNTNKQMHFFQGQRKYKEPFHESQGEVQCKYAQCCGNLSYTNKVHN